MVNCGRRKAEDEAKEAKRRQEAEEKKRKEAEEAARKAALTEEDFKDDPVGLSDFYKDKGNAFYKQKQFEELTATKNSELATLQATLEKKKETLGEDTKTMTDSAVERDETQAQLKADEKFFEETKSACKAKADDWAERSRLRTEELAGINKAIEILTSDEAQATFGRATSMLLQSSQTHKTGNPAKAKAYQALKTVAKKHHSLRMAAMAAMVQTATEGHFDVVIGSVL